MYGRTQFCAEEQLVSNTAIKTKKHTKEPSRICIWKHWEAFVVSVFGLLVQVGVRCSEWLYVVVVSGIGLGCEGVSVPLLWGNSTSCIYLQTVERAVGHYSSTAASSCPGWQWLVL